jgi:hypothetical protein
MIRNKSRVSTSEIEASEDFDPACLGNLTWSGRRSVCEKEETRTCSRFPFPAAAVSEKRSMPSFIHTNLQFLLIGTGFDLISITGK